MFLYSYKVLKLCSEIDPAQTSVNSPFIKLLSVSFEGSIHSCQALNTRAKDRKVTQVLNKGERSGGRGDTRGNKHKRKDHL